MKEIIKRLEILLEDLKYKALTLEEKLERVKLGEYRLDCLEVRLAIIKVCDTQFITDNLFEYDSSEAVRLEAVKRCALKDIFRFSEDTLTIRLVAVERCNAEDLYKFINDDECIRAVAARRCLKKLLPVFIQDDCEKVRDIAIERFGESYE